MLFGTVIACEFRGLESQHNLNLRFLVSFCQASGMAEESDRKIEEKDIVGLKYFDPPGCARASLGSLSESVAVFDSERLKPIIESLGEKLVPIAADKRLKDLQQTLTLLDGSIVEALPRIAMASFRDAQSGSGKKMKWTLHVLQREAQSSGASCCDRSEATQVEGKAGDGIHWAKLRRLPAHWDESAGLAGRTHCVTVPLPMDSRDVLSFFKHLLGCRHLLSHSQNGIEAQVYCAIIACMLISLWRGRKPTLRTHEMIC
jgi:hypothetical protein